MGALGYRPRPVGPRRLHGPILTIVLICIALFVGLRMEIGGDWSAYLGHFQYYSSVGFSDIPTGRLDPGFGLLNWLVARLGLSSVWVNVFSAAIFCWGLRIFLKDEPSPWLALVVAVPYLIIVVAMGYTRQSIAIGFLLVALVDFRKTNSLVRVAALLAVGAMFHKTVVVMFPVLALAQDRHIAVKAAMLGGLALMLYYAFASAASESLYTNYVVEEYDAAGAAIRLFMSSVPAVIYLVRRKKFGFNATGEKIWRNIAIGSILLLVAIPLFSSSVFLDRLGLYFLPIQMMVFNRLPFTTGRQGYNGRVALGVICGYAAVLFVWLTTGDNAEWWLPYELYLSSAEQESRLIEDAMSDIY